MRFTENFSLREFRCRCGCGIEREHVEDLRETAEMCQRARDLIGWPLIVRTGVRCDEYNRQCGGAKRSQHLPSQGARAADLVLMDGEGKPTLEEFWVILQANRDAIGFNGAGYYKRPPSDPRPSFIHIDRRPGRYAEWGNGRPAMRRG